MKHRIASFLSALALLFLPTAAFAACSGPAGNAGDFIYNSAYYVYQYCDGTHWDAMGPKGASTAGYGYNTVFVTSTTYTGDIGSVAAGTADCAARATAAGLSGTYYAWLAVTTNTDDPNTLFTKSTIPYEEVNGTVVASNWTQLTSGTLTNAITVSELNGAAGSTDVWTNVATNGTATSSGSSSTGNCSAWTYSGSSGSDHGEIGLSSSSSSTWTADGTSSKCNPTYSLYCFQQNGVAATCSNPTANPGDMIYNSAKHLYQFCGGTNWLAMGPTGAGGSGCTSPTGNEADIIFNSTLNVMQYCNGAAWVAFGK